MNLRSTFNFSRENFNTSINEPVEFSFKQEDFKIQSEIYKPYNCEGYATVWIQVNDLSYQRTFEHQTPDIRIVNFVSKFINDKDYRERFNVERNRHTSSNVTDECESERLNHENN
ncbi:hypothetical protein [Mucilaginibacter kameinonensis]|uniref:hypothetical protein n=1 Tax=Mucilaginibacter kameinonensis TaxID=452286 RepID=UPI000EF84E24|nr:hypothetical protein [Mucilaginibacter kameinonensis]